MDSATWVEQTSGAAINMVATDSATEISAVSLTTTTTGVATAAITFTCTGCTGDGVKKAAYAVAGACGTGRVGEAVIDNAAKTFPAVTFDTSGTYVVCYASDGATWVEQTTGVAINMVATGVCGILVF